MADLTLEQAEALGRRWMACGGFEWRTGMLALYIDPDASGCDGRPVIIEGETVLRIEGDTLITYGEGTEEVEHGPACYHIPDLRNPSTKGHALEQMRAAWDDPYVTIMGWEAGRWTFVGDLNGARRDGATCTSEAEAIVTAMEAANG